ncbi:MAG: dihydrofolate reductase family protein [Bacteroidales bacterium]
MRKVILYLAISLDGYIADENNGVSWIEGEDPDYTGDVGYGAFISNIDTVILGWSTYNQIITELSPDHWVYGGMNSYVITHKEMEDKEDISFWNKDLESLIHSLKDQEGKDIWICGGASIANQLMKLNLLDEYQLTIAPTLLGNGVKLFEEGRPRQNLHLVSTETLNGFVNLVYKKR